MFDFKNKINQQPIESEQDLDLESVEKNNIFQEKDEIKTDKNLSENEIKTSLAELEKIQVRTMPDKFLAGDKKSFKSNNKTKAGKISGFKKNILIGIGIGVLVIALLGLAGFFLLKSIESPSNANNVQTQEQKNTENTQEKQDGSTQNDGANSEEPKEKINKLIQECSSENCELCLQDECLEFADFCHLEDQCKYENYNYEYEEEIYQEKICPDFVCVKGPEIKKYETEKQEEEKLLLSLDFDNDLLTDVEEELWGTDLENSDTDNDTYLDGEEILNFYNPNLGEGSKLQDEELIKTFTNSKFGYSIIYPSKWQLSQDDLTNQIIFKSSTGEFVQVIIEENFAGFLTAKNWYLSQNSSVEESDLEEILIGNWSGVKSPDKLNVYLVNNNYIYTIAMNIGLKNELNYSTTFEMMLNSFKLFESPLD